MAKSAPSAVARTEEETVQRSAGKTVQRSVQRSATVNTEHCVQEIEGMAKSERDGKVRQGRDPPRMNVLLSRSGMSVWKLLELFDPIINFHFNSNCAQSMCA
jgi:hypothetical protein